MSPNYISKLHEADLLNKYSYQAQNLDLIELSALYGSLPDESLCLNDALGKKKKYKSDLLVELKKMITLHQQNKLPSNKIRNPIYKHAVSLFEDNNDLYSLVDSSQLSEDTPISSDTISINYSELSSQLMPSISSNENIPEITIQDGHVRQLSMLMMNLLVKSPRTPQESSISSKYSDKR
jgi:hypothetical protein